MLVMTKSEKERHFFTIVCKLDFEGADRYFKGKKKRKKEIGPIYLCVEKKSQLSKMILKMLKGVLKLKYSVKCRKFCHSCESCNKSGPSDVDRDLRT